MEISNSVTTIFENIDDGNLPEIGDVNSINALKVLIESLDPASHEFLLFDLKRLCYFLEHQMEVLGIYLKEDSRFRVRISDMVESFEEFLGETPTSDISPENAAPIGMAASDLSALLEANGFPLSADKDWILCHASMVTSTQYFVWQDQMEGGEVIVSPEGVIIETVGE
jgi:hypothetical protein